jgi:cell division protein FtsB
MAISYIQVSLKCIFFAFQAEVSKDIATLTQKNKEIEETVATLQQQSDKMNIDEAVVPTTPLYNQ